MPDLNIATTILIPSINLVNHIQTLLNQGFKFNGNLINVD